MWLSQVGTFRSDIAGFGAGFMSGLKPPTYSMVSWVDGVSGGGLLNRCGHELFAALVQTAPALLGFGVLA
jgi:hypothetical protein